MRTRNTQRLGVLFQFGMVLLAWLGLGAVLQFSTDKHSLESLNEISRAQHTGGRFVFADLDGDQKPDLASVELQSQRSEPANYWIHLQLSHGAESAIDVRAPFGGLQVAARDVNGDDKLDLILTSNLDAGFIAVLLNDGHGNFSAAPPGLLKREKENDSELRRPAAPQLNQAILALGRSSLEEALATKNDDHPIFSSGASSQARVQDPSRSSTRLQLGRSPPLAVSL
jgi:VCBS repeat protein